LLASSTKDMANILRAASSYILLPIILSLFIIYVIQTPKYSGTQHIHNRKYNPITIKRDDFGVPSIEAKTFVDTIYGLGYAQAQDRLWALTTRKMLVAGRISEIAGEKTLEVDKFFRNIGIQRYCQYAMENTDSKTLELYQAFADGINDFVENSRTLPLEFWLTWTQYEKFTVLDTLTNAKFIAFFLTFDFPFEFMQQTLEDLLGPVQAANVLPHKGEDFFWKDVVVMNDDELKQQGIYEKFDEKRVLEGPQGDPFPPERQPPVSSGSKKATQEAPKAPKEEPKGTKTVKPKGKGPADDVILNMAEAQMGSNSWVVHGSLTDTGKPILANDPHLMNGIPTVWYPSSLFWEGGYVSGVGLVGFPGVHVGKTEHISWGCTTLCSDTADLYVLTTKENKYLYEGEYHPLREFKETIKVKGRKEPVEITIYETHHGVVLDYYFPNMFITRDFRPREGVRYALAWPGYAKEDKSYQSFFNMIKAKNSQEILDSWKDALVPAFSFLFATAEGDIGFFGAGKIPIRPHARDGLKPKDGSLKKNDWLGLVPWKDQPKLVNPKKGFIVSANNKMATDNLKYFTSANQFTTSRAARIDEMIRDLVKKGKKITVEDNINIQKDTLDVLAREITPIMIDRTYDALKKGYNLTVSDEKLTLLLKNLTNWDYTSGKESIPATIFNVWERFFIRKVIRNIGLSEQDIKSMIVNAKWDHFLYRNMLSWKKNIPKEQDMWCRNEENQDITDPCLYDLAKSLEEAYLFIEKALGDDIEEWQWSKIHRMEYPHGTFSQTPLKPLYHRSIPSQGNGRTVDVARMKMETDSFGGVWSPNLKMVVSMKKGEKSYFIVDTGVSESMFSEHYDDMMRMVEDGKYLTINEAPLDDWKDVTYLKFKGKGKGN